MGRTCSVPGCCTGRNKDYTQRKKSGLRQLSLFKLPKCKDRLTTWKKSLGCSLEIKQYVCELHFLEKHIRKNDTLRLVDGTISTIPRIHWLLEEDAVPLGPDAIVLHQRDAELSDQGTVQNHLTGDRKNTFCAPKCTTNSKTLVECTEHEGNVYSDDVVLNDDNVMKCEPAQGAFFSNEIAEHDRQDKRGISVVDIQRDLSTAYLPEGWAWCQKGYDIFFTNYTASDFSVRQHLVLSSDMSLNLHLNTGAVIVLDTITSLADVIGYMKTMKKFTVCTGTGIESERFDRRCGGILEPDEEYKRKQRNPRCLLCQQLRKKLLQRRKQKRMEEKYAASKVAAESARRKCIRLKKKAANLTANVARLQKKCCEIKEHTLKEKIVNLSETQQQAVRACFEAAKVKSGKRRRYTTQWTYECLLMRIKNASLYKHLRDREILLLPTRKTLNRYIQKISASTYGFHQSVFECLKRKGERMDDASKRGVLLVDEMKLSEEISFDRQTMQFGGFVDLGKHTPESMKNTRADHALVFMYQPFRGKWVQALACFLSKDSVTSAVLHKLILECVVLLSTSGFHVDAVTMDGAQWNRGVWNIFGINDTKLSCEYPCNEKKRLWMISDFPHLIKCFRTGVIKNPFFKTPDGKVKKAYWEALLRCENFAKSNLKLAYRLTPAHLNPIGYQKMNVPLAFQLFLPCVQAAMQVYETSDPQLKTQKPPGVFAKEWII